MPAVFLTANEFIDNFNFFVVFTHIVGDRYPMPGSFDVIFRFFMVEVLHHLPIVTTLSPAANALFDNCLVQC